MKVHSEISTRQAGSTNADGRNLRKLEKAARDFESILVGQFFKLMHSTVGEDGVVEKSFPRKLYEEMIQDEFAREFTKRGGFNLQKVLVERFASGEISGADANRRPPAAGDTRSIGKPDDGFRGQTAGFRPLMRAMSHGKISDKEFMPLQGGDTVAPDERKK